MLGLLGQVGQDLLPEFLFGHHLDLLHELAVLGGEHGHHVLHQALMEVAGAGAEVEDPVEGQDQGGDILGGVKGHHRIRLRAAGEGLPEDLPLPDQGEDGLVPPHILLDHLHRPGEHHPDEADVLLLQSDVGPPGIAPDLAPQAVQHGPHILRPNPLKQRA